MYRYKCKYLSSCGDKTIIKIMVLSPLMSVREQPFVAKTIVPWLLSGEKRSLVARIDAKNRRNEDPGLLCWKRVARRSYAYEKSLENNFYSFCMDDCGGCGSYDDLYNCVC